MNNYFYLDNAGVQQGPISPMQFNAYGVNAHTMVWCNGMGDWMHAGDIPELYEFISSVGSATSQTPPPHASTGNFAGNDYNNNQSSIGVCPDSNLVWGILCTILCCLPLGIVSIVYACKVENLFYAGDVAGAREASRKARNWALYGGIATLIVYVIAIILYAAFFAALLQGALD